MAERNCKECFHYKACKEVASHNGFRDIRYTESECNHFTPTADVVEVKHGYWKDRYGNKYDNHLYECSVCGEIALYEFYANELGQEESRQVLTPGCPHCLAVMDGGTSHG